ncbi:hypothetical protein JHK84_051588 [Glycine max]|uniref:Phenolic glucoside malonyltransferase 2 n=1 Tax=Glycine soja TaxID=3848 RepID=A0A445FY77_GLYSO|nr:phenolic glucoside malonyltransferase 1-like [Glycine soja]KAG4925895.1 hypothetical protein JHK87_051435 [Glycine soja]KAG5096000.1 hypothetical protein JHK84_051588 [Glycine max]KHN13544.1 Agmatine coumaroyltransferase [Glycine soja]RZB53869.1 Phenolic glucoside malonyltransferase 2 [Glycine soja]
MVVLQEVFNVVPTSESEEFQLPTQTSLSLTFFDILWLRLPPVQRVFFYEFPHPTHLFFDTLLPKLKHSLSLALAHFFPLAGHLTWPLHSQKPIINYKSGDTVPLTVAVSEADFNHLAGTDLYEAKEIPHLLPHLTISHEKATLLALQATLFPNSGFSIGITSHHAVLDGKTSTSFIKSWAYLCRESQSPTSLPPELIPFYDREVIKDPNHLGVKYVSDWLEQNGPNNRSLLVWDLQAPEDATRGIFQLSRSDIEKLKQIVVSKKKGNNTNLRLSTFVLSIAYACVFRVRAEETKNKRVMLALNVDCRARLEPPIPPTYFGNCVGARLAIAETREILGEDGLIVVVDALNDALGSLKDGALSGAENWSRWLLESFSDDVRIIGVAGSPRFEAYSNDFGWGRPKKVEMASIDRTGAFCLSDSKNGDGVEVSFVSNKRAMETFAYLFANGLRS